MDKIGADRFRILIVMDDHPLTKVVAFALNHGVYIQRIETTFEGARHAVLEMRPHLAVVDVAADGGRAIALVDERAGEQRLPVIALTRRGELAQALAVLDRGADDIITVPFVPADLIARVHALIRRAYGTRSQIVPVIRVGDLSIDILNRRVSAGKAEVHLTSLEQALLYLLAANSGSVISREVILDALWGTDFVTETNLVERHIRALRVKLRDDHSRTPYIQTVPDPSYRLDVLQDAVHPNGTRGRVPLRRVEPLTLCPRLQP